jgi:predicted dehydrogenase
MQVGVIGLGRHWQERYRPALRALRDRFRVRLVCDQVEHLARREARRLGCGAALGPTELLESDAVEAVLLPDAQWFGLWPLQLACRVGKPAFCSDDLLPGEADPDGLAGQARDSGVPVVVGLGPRHAAVTGALAQLLADRLGPARGVACDFIVPPGPAGPPAGLPVPPSLLDWCAAVLAAEPVSVLAAGTDDGAFASLLLEFPGDRRAQLTGWRTDEAWHAPRLRVFAARGWATADLSGRLHWADAEGRHGSAPRGQPPPEQLLLDRFFHAAAGRQPPEPNLSDACRILGWLRAAERSRAQGARVALG